MHFFCELSDVAKALFSVLYFPYGGPGIQRQAWKIVINDLKSSAGKQVRNQGDTKGFIPLKLPKIGLTTGTDVAKYQNGCKRATVQLITWVCYVYITTFLCRPM